MSLPIRPAEINVYVGDSITGGTFPWWTQYQAAISPHVVGRTALTTPVAIGATTCGPAIGATSTATALGGTTYSSSWLQYVNSGLNIDQIRQQQNSWLVGGVAAGATIYYVECGVNNVFGANKDVPGAQSSSLQLLADIHAAAPSAKVAWVNAFSGGSEQVPYAPTDADMTTVNGYIAAAVAANPSFAYLFDVRTGQQAYEAANNTPSPGVASGVLTLDGTHPNATGQAFYSTTAQTQITYV